MNATVTTRSDVERALWMQSAWQIEQTDVDRILAVVDAYAAGAPAGPPGVSAEELKRQVHDSYEAGVAHGEQRVRRILEPELERARAEAAERPSTGLAPLPEGVTPGGCYEAADGTVWLALGVPQSIALPRIPQQRSAGSAVVEDTTTRKCRACGHVKPLESGFTKDKASQAGRRWTCRTCEADQRTKKKRRDAAPVPS